MKVKPYLDPSVDCLSPADYARLSGPRSGLNLRAVRAGVGVVEALRNSFRVVSTVVLGKGEQVRDSRSPGVLRAELRLVSPAGGLYGRVGAAVRAVLAEAGRYTVLLDLVDEGWAWFASEGAARVAFSLEVS